MRDLIAWLPKPGPIITFQQVRNCFGLWLGGGLKHHFRQFAGKKVASTNAKSGGIRQDILGIIVSITSTCLFDSPCWPSLKQDESSGGPSLSDKEAAADASFIVVAGSDTISQGTTALFRYVVGNKMIQTRLRSEINAAFDVGDDFDSVKLAKLPYLDACVRETLRLVPPIAAGMMIVFMYFRNVSVKAYSHL